LFGSLSELESGACLALNMFLFLDLGLGDRVFSWFLEASVIFPLAIHTLWKHLKVSSPAGLLKSIFLEVIL